VSDDQVDDVRERLSGTWRVNGMEVYWMVTKIPKARQTVVHALGTSGTHAMCGASMDGMWGRRRYVATALRCPACVSYLQENGRLG